MVAPVSTARERSDVTNGSSSDEERRRGWRRLLPAKLCRDQRGHAAVEFALVAPAFFFLMFVIAETALVFIAEQVMDNAVFETARLIRTGQVQNGGMSADEFKDEVCDRMSVFIDCDGNFYLEVKTFPTFDDMADYVAGNLRPIDEEGEFKTADAFDFGDESEIVIVRAYYQWATNKIFGLSLQTPELGNGKRLIGTFAAFRNEPYGDIETP
jgi:hypothetical protein